MSKNKQTSWEHVTIFNLEANISYLQKTEPSRLVLVTNFNRIWAEHCEDLQIVHVWAVFSSGEDDVMRSASLYTDPYVFQLHQNLLIQIDPKFV